MVIKAQVLVGGRGKAGGVKLAKSPEEAREHASRILGMGDLLSLIEEAERKVDKVKAEKLANKIKKGKGFDLEDFKEQLQQMKNMGGVASIMDKMPGLGALPPGASKMVDDSAFRQMEAIINSMTMKERMNPDMLNGSRKRRIVSLRMSYMLAPIRSRDSSVACATSTAANRCACGPQICATPWRKRRTPTGCATPLL